MHKIVHGKFIEKEGFWFNVIQVGKSEFLIFNTRRKRKLNEREGLGYYIADTEFKTLSEAKKYLENSKKVGYEI